ncbi:ribonuclease J [Candidatus Peregrinibacteria bacterium]|jgi:ribonuclease J|nr:ribonuclease J [Candidatus Peregrinibacteria bacterium]MBT4147874.1 ribonuclease J [Candidatus Peregrinibacteria bacterium]MBT4366081.1 ribonuclease J [Candidatus Peregrinibacteria bacterium]MBT4455852.1 ribonuclease J [Candidatus Peregrinibacteria bacterium]
MDKISEWITKTIEQGDDRPISTTNLNKGKKSKKKNNKKPYQQKKGSSQQPQKQKQPQKKPRHQQKKPQPQRQQPQKSKPGRRHKVDKPKTNKGKSNKPLLSNFKGLRVIPIGGLNEVGKNCMAFEYNQTGQPKDKEIIVVDMGFQFPEEDMLGVDYVIPDSTYLEENKRHIKGILITHGHLDHTGGLAYLLPKLNFPHVFATRLTKGLIEERIKEFKIEKQTKISKIDPDKSIQLGHFKVDFFRVAHSIPDAVGLIISTPEGKLVHTGDFKFDASPSGNQRVADIKKIEALGSQNVLALFSDSTNALKPGHTMSESEVGKNLEDVIKQSKGRIIIASFSSLIGRIQQIFEYAEKANRKIYISGRSMENNIKIALKLGVLKIKTNQIANIKKLKEAKDDEVIVLTTGSQGEAVSALTRISLQEHQHIRIKKGDTVVVSASPIVGNERSIFTVVNNLCLLGAKVIHSQIMDIHTSGHGYRDELTQMMKMVRPKYFVPIHGEYFMRQAHKELATKNGIPEERCVMMRNGFVLEISHSQLKLSKEKVPASYILIDGLGEGTIGSQVMVDRQKMSLNGIIVITLEVNRKTRKLKAAPNVMSRGFMYMHEYEVITAELAKLVEQSYKDFIAKRPKADRKEVKKYIVGVADRYTRQTLERKPLIMPLVFEA